MSVDSRNIKVLAEEAKTQREHIMIQADRIVALEGHITELHKEVSELRQTLMLFKYQRGIGATA